MKRMRTSWEGLQKVPSDGTLHRRRSRFHDECSLICPSALNVSSNAVEVVKVVNGVVVVGEQKSGSVGYGSRHWSCLEQLIVHRILKTYCRLNMGQHLNI